eukprot:11062919-Prorocentrum_lima.AAC.1
MGLISLESPFPPPVPVLEEGLVPLGWGSSPARAALPQGSSPQAGSYFYGLSPAASRSASPMTEAVWFMNSPRNPASGT